MAYVLPSTATTGEAGRLKALVAKYFPVYEVRVTQNSLIMAVQTDKATMPQKFDQLRQELWPMNYVPMVREHSGETIIEVLRRPMRTTWKPLTNVVMLVATIITSLFAGAFLWVAYVGGSSLDASALLWGALTFAIPLLAILGFHELAHFVVARRHHVEASLPFFIPMPPPFVIFGTFGAFISLREPIPDRKALVDIGAAGPIAGFALAVPITLAGLFLTQHHPIALPLNNCGPSFLSIPYGNLSFGSSALFYALALFFPKAWVVQLNPLAIAGWVGLLVTAINLLPAGQLDGGHVFRALFGPRAVLVSWVSVGALFFLGIWYPGWWIFGFLILILGPRHPPPLNDITPLDWKRQGIGIAAAAILITGFVAVPLSTPTGGFHVTQDNLVAGGNIHNSTYANLSLTINNDDFAPHAFWLFVGLAKNNTTWALWNAWVSNLTWTIQLPNGTTWTTSGATVGANYSVPGEAFFCVSSNGTGKASCPSPYSVHLVISNPAPPPDSPATTPRFVANVKVVELCASAQGLQNGQPWTTTFTYPA
ncbi:MAG: site-2 protease family protein [Euryarchaeota archaeon]|nr:site-2 protease family protein [Euryarchaeota archaeon]MDE1836217.1 site-2 protease family protein [Euryarchaeota archaeon]MDE1880870.1 site-2 protease family protein [Euryarchaeota archaeon]MDE2045022.1 site-2 protease family protein [Thermoplasmata archaeon]